ncbi:DUF5994 family protein [Streptomyces mutabilis]|uniref:DUF5994 family protein n=1 Tax=Streptomyces mutabilis TaxID=67332 RepID=UPI00351A1B88
MTAETGDAHDRIRSPFGCPARAGWRSRGRTARICARTTESREGALDGAWWPRSRDVRGELPALRDVLHRERQHHPGGKLIATGSAPTSPE